MQPFYWNGWDILVKVCHSNGLNNNSANAAVECTNMDNSPTIAIGDWWTIYDPNSSNIGKSTYSETYYTNENFSNCNVGQYDRTEITWQYYSRPNIVFSRNQSTARQAAVEPSLMETDQIRLFPNPAVNSIQIDAPGASQYAIYDLTGKTVLISSQETINISLLSEGSYFAVAFDEKGLPVARKIFTKQN